MRRKRHVADAIDICKADIAAYTQIWEDAQRAEPDQIVALEQAVAAIEPTLLVDEPRQPASIGGHDDTTSAEYLFALMEAFKAVDDGVFGPVAAVADRLGLEWHEGPPKKDERCLEKAKLAYCDDYARLKDIRRGSMVCPTVGHIVEALQALHSDGATRPEGCQVLRVKNRFDRTYDAKMRSAGYRDVQLNVRVPGTALVAEVQLHLAAAEKLKSTLRDQADGIGRTGHQRYVSFRSIMERLD